MGRLIYVTIISPIRDEVCVYHITNFARQRISEPMSKMHNMNEKALYFDAFLNPFCALRVISFVRCRVDKHLSLAAESLSDST